MLWNFCLMFEFRKSFKINAWFFAFLNQNKKVII